MNFIKTIHDELVNLDHVYYIHIEDRGSDYSKRYRILADGPEYMFTLAEHENKDVIEKMFSKIAKRLEEKLE